MTFGQALRDSRLSAFLTQRQLAERLNVHHTYISKLENDATEHPPSRKLIIDMAVAMEADTERLLQLARSEDENRIAELEAENKRLHHALAVALVYARGYVSRHPATEETVSFDQFNKDIRCILCGIDCPDHPTDEED